MSPLPRGVCARQLSRGGGKLKRDVVQIALLAPCTSREEPTCLVQVATQRLHEHPDSKPNLGALIDRDNQMVLFAIHNPRVKAIIPRANADAGRISQALTPCEGQAHTRKWGR